MRRLPRKICPLRALTNALPAHCECFEERCGWFYVDYDEEEDVADGDCALVHIASAFKEFQHRPPCAAGGPPPVPEKPPVEKQDGDPGPEGRDAG